MRIRLAALVATALSCCTLAASAVNPVEPTAGYQAQSRPSGDVTLSFVRPGRIAAIPVEEGDTVKAGQIVAKQDDDEELKLLAVDKADAEDETEIEAEKAVFQKDKVTLERFEGNTSASALEIEEKRLAVIVDQARIKLAVTKKKKAEYKYEASEAGVTKLAIKSPISGSVAKVMMHVGEAADAQNSKVLRIVQIDPLWIEVAVPILEARRLKPGDAADAFFLDGKTRPGKVSIISPVAESASQSINVRVEVPNPEKLQPGENVRVSFPGLRPVAANPSH